MWNYTDKMIEYFRNPKNVGEIESPDAVGEVGNIVCGDALKLTLKIDKATGKIIDAKFKTFGCASAIASSSALTEMIKGRTIDEAAGITNQDIAEYLGGLPNEKMHCSVMGMEALEAAVENYRGGRGGKHIVGSGEKIVCKCFQVTDVKIFRAIKENNLKTVEQVTNYTKAGGGCGQCVPELEKLLKEFWEKQATKTGETQGKMTLVKKIHLIEKILEQDINPKLNKDGGSAELVDIDGDVVRIKFSGACVGCPMSGVTMRSIIEKELKEKVDFAVQVEESV
ncbi:MAG: Fe-S cluster assembly protein NifU [Elusimicrobia bacterium]|nr:Fe-S cluster assembly protein NifU [Elusimicrobiota bacterium]